MNAPNDLAHRAPQRRRGGEAPRPRRAGGFTVIELMVVTGIIVLLASILMPTLTAARNRTKQLDCLNRMHKIHGAIMLYASDHRQTIPPMKSYGTGVLDGFMEQLEAYDMEDQDWVCPSEVDVDPADHNSYNGRRLDYGYNHYGRGDGDTANYFDTIDPMGGGATPNRGAPRITAVASQRSIFFTDSDPKESPHDLGGVDRGTMVWPIKASFVPFRHDGQYNGLSLDGAAMGYEGWKPNNEQWFLRKNN